MEKRIVGFFLPEAKFMCSGLIEGGFFEFFDLEKLNIVKVAKVFLIWTSGGCLVTQKETFFSHNVNNLHFSIIFLDK